MTDRLTFLDWLLEKVTHCFDALHVRWESDRMQRQIAGVFIVTFLGGLATIELNRRGILPPSLAKVTPLNHFHAVSLAFTLVLLLEIISLVFVLPCSVSKSVGKQFEILSLILLRNSFKELSYLSEPVHLSQSLDVVIRIASSTGGALCIFLALSMYYRLQRHDAGRMDKLDRYGFVATKKAIALLLLAIFILTGIHSLVGLVMNGTGHDFFATFYTVLIFSDILIVLVSQRYQPSFHLIFRNSGYALATLLMRLALTAPRYWDALIGVGAALFALGLTVSFNAYTLQRGRIVQAEER